VSVPTVPLPDVDSERVATLDRVEKLATEGAWQDHVLPVRKRA
jgi:hypothetical protein